MNNIPSDEPTRRGTWQPLSVSFETAIERLPNALQEEGFGVVTQIDLQQTFKAKLGVDFRRYRIFGACNPAYALQAVKLDPRAGLLLPCNIVLFERDDGIVMLGMIDPMQQLNAPSGTLADLAREIKLQLTRVARSMANATTSEGIA